jgi:hypothetical protein
MLYKIYLWWPEKNRKDSKNKYCNATKKMAYIDPDHVFIAVAEIPG